MELQEFEYQRRYEPVARAFVASDGKTCQVVALLGKSDITSEEEWYIRDAYKALSKRYGAILYFSRPERSASFVYRSEREFLESEEQRFAWRTHFFQADPAKPNVNPGRYCGFVFQRPDRIHVLYTQGPSSSPAVCEGYLRPPLSLQLWPNYSRALRHYAQPYQVLPFDSIPFFCARYGASCGHSALAAAMLMSLDAPCYSPYEIAVAIAGAKNAKDSELHPGKQFRTIGLNLPDLQKILPKVFGRNSIASKIRFRKDSMPVFSREQNDLTNVLNAYLYQGIPVLYAVDYSKLYNTTVSDIDLLTHSKDMTKQDDHHIILIHSIVKQGEGESGDPQYVYADSTNLHSTGDIFHRATVARLLAARVRTDSAADEAWYAVCVPNEFQLTPERAAIHYQLLAEEFPELRDLVTNPDLADFSVRHVAQLRSNLLRTVFPDVHREAHYFRKPMQQIRTKLDNFSLPNFVWMVKRRFDDVTVGAFLDTRRTDIDFEDSFRGWYMKGANGSQNQIHFRGSSGDQVETITVTNEMFTPAK